MAGDPTVVASDVYKTVFENDKVRVLESRLAPGQKTEMHHHPDHVGIAISAATFTFTTTEGETVEVQLEPGQQVWVDATDHATENTGSTELVAVIVELK